MRTAVRGVGVITTLRPMAIALAARVSPDTSACRLLGGSNRIEHARTSFTVRPPTGRRGGTRVWRRAAARNPGGTRSRAPDALDAGRVTGIGLAWLFFRSGAICRAAFPVPRPPALLNKC
jgi:hypothetical protein